MPKQPTAPKAHALRPIAPGPEPLDPQPDEIYVAMGGTITIENEDGSIVRGLKVIIGSTLKFRPYKIIACDNCAQLIGLH
jgi:hypothetical protein